MIDFGRNYFKTRLVDLTTQGSASIWQSFSIRERILAKSMTPCVPALKYQLYGQKGFAGLLRLPF